MSTVCVITVQAVVVCVGEDRVWRDTLEKNVTRRPRRATLTDCRNTVTSTHTVHTQDCILCKILLLLLLLVLIVAAGLDLFFCLFMKTCIRFSHISHLVNVNFSQQKQKPKTFLFSSVRFLVSFLFLPPPPPF